ncbi:MAG: Hpt domain-containing protein [Pseudomonadota bacterium]
MAETHDFLALDWVKGEIEETLKQAQQALEAHVENPEDQTRLRFCLTYLHQVYGTLQMVEFYGAALLAEEMEKLTQALLNNKVPRVADAQETLMRGMLQMPVYLDRIKASRRDMPMVLLPLLNDIRAARGEKLLSEGALFKPDMAQSAAAGEVSQAVAADPNLAELLRKIRQMFQLGLLGVIRGENLAINVSHLAKVAMKLEKISGDAAISPLWKVTGAVIEGLSNNSIDNSTAMKLLLGQVDRQIKTLVDRGAPGFAEKPAPDLFKNLLFYVARSQSDSPLITQVRKTYKLDDALLSEEAIDEERARLSGPDRQTMASVAGAISEELSRVKEALDIFMRGGAQSKVADLAPHVATLKQVSDTIAMLGLGQQRKLVLDQYELLERIVHDGKLENPGVLMDIAGALLYVEATLAGHSTDKSQSKVPATPQDALTQDEIARARDAVVRECRAGLELGKEKIVEYIASQWERSHIQDVPATLVGVRGGLQMIGLYDAGAVLQRAVDFVNSELLSEGAQPDWKRMDTLADAISSVEYYLERVTDDPESGGHILDIARKSVAELGYAVAPDSAARKKAEAARLPAPEVSEEVAEIEAIAVEEVAVAPEPERSSSPKLADELSDELDAEPSLDVPMTAAAEHKASFADEEAPLVDEDTLALAELVEDSASPAEEIELVDADAPEFLPDAADLIEAVPHAPAVPPAPAAAVPAPPASPGGDGAEEHVVDEEVVEIFVEEIGEVMNHLDEYFPQWVANQQDEMALKEFRRGFHTLKGSGRMVGAKYVGELAWSIENMLNRVIDKTIVPTPVMIELIRTVRGIAPEMVTAFAERRKSPYLVESLMECANAFARGEQPAAVPPLELRGAPKAAPVGEAVEPAVADVADAQESEVIDVEMIEPAAAATEAASIDEDALEFSADELLAAEAEVIDMGGSVELATGEEPAVTVEEIAAVEAVPAAPARPGLPDVDPVLMEVFASESEQHIATLDAWLASLDPDMQHHPITDDLLRAMHTLKGSAKMAGVMPVAEIAAPTEKFCKDLRNNGELADTDVVALVREATNLIRLRVKRLLPDPYAPIPGAQAYLEMLHAIEQSRHAAWAAAETPEVTAQVAVQPRPGLINDLLHEGLDHVLDGGDYAAQWSQQGVVAADLDAMRVELVRLSRAAKRGGITPMADIAQRLRHVYNNLDSGTLMLSSNVVAALQHGHEAIIGMMDCMAAHQSIWPATEALQALDEVAAGLPPMEPEAEPEPVAAVSTATAAAAAHDALEFSADELLAAEAEVLDVAGSFEPSEIGEAEAAEGVRLPEGVVEPVVEDIAAVPATPAAAALPDVEEVQAAMPPAFPADEDEHEDGIVPDRDPELVAIFLEEADELVESAGTSLEAWMNNVDNLIEVQKLQRDLHTLKGGARMAEIPQLGDLAHELENLYEGLSQGSLSAQPSLFKLLNICHDRIADMVDSIRTRGHCRNANNLIAMIHAYIKDPVGFVVETPAAPKPVAPHEARPGAPVEAIPVPHVIDEAPVAAAPEPAPVDEDLAAVDPDILGIFLEEAEDLTAQLDAAISGWKTEPTNPEHSDELKRVLHTLKGGARLAGLKRLGDISHHFETRVIDLGPKTPDTAFFGEINGYHDEISALVERVRAGGNAAIAAAVAAAAAPPQPAAPAAAPTAETAPTPAAPAQRAADKDDRRAPAQQGQRQVQQQEAVKVPADLLEKLVNLAGETSINRGRLEQQVTDFRFTISEMGSTISRLAEQLRRLNAEADEQVKANWEAGKAEGKYSGEFDPLEMDQYSSLHQLTKQLFESASDLLDIRDTLTNKTRDTETLLLQQSRVNTELQEGLMRSRMVPFSRLIPRLRRIVRQVSGELKKNVEIEFINPEGEMDRALLERIVAPLEHMLRNACDHGVESPDARVAAGKSAQGHIRLALSREGGEVVLTISDDGKGINVAAVRKKAMERGLMDETSELTDHDIMQFILEAGFSTAEKVTQISGRGVGMDVVSSEIKQMGGALMIRSEVGKGTTFEIRLPFTVSVNRALMVRVGEDQFAIPLVQIEGIVRVSPYELETYYGADAPPFEYAGEAYRLNYLGGFVHGVPAPDLHGMSTPLPVLLVRGSDHSVAIQVDQLIGSREVVVKAVGPQLSTVAGISGATILGDGRVVIILDLLSLIRAAHLQHEMQLAQQRRLAQRSDMTEQVRAPAVREVPLIMVTDDSVTVRKVTGRFLERQGFEVVTAKDGMDAVAQLADVKPDLMLLDIEMPRMDGFEVASHCRHDSRLQDLPIIMITSRTGEKHRERAMEIGVNAYLGKPFQENELLAKINELLAERRAKALH